MSQHVEIDCLDWRTFSQAKKDDLWNLVQDTFFFPVSPTKIEDIKKWVLSDMGIKLKSWRYELRNSSFDPSLTVDEIVAAQQDSRVDQTQFRKLVTSWKNEKTQTVSDKKKKIRSKSNEPHVTGTKSFARLVHEQKKKNNGVRMSRGATYRMSRTRKDGSVVNGQAAKVIDQLKSIPDESSSTTAGIIDYRNDDLAKVKGPEKGGRIRCLGKVVRAKNKGSCSSEDTQVPQMKARINELQAEVNEMRETKVKQEAVINEMKENQEAMFRFMAIVKDQLPNANLSSIFNSLNTQVTNDSCSVYIHHPKGNTTTSHGSQNENYSSSLRC